MKTPLLAAALCAAAFGHAWADDFAERLNQGFAAVKGEQAAFSAARAAAKTPARKSKAVIDRVLEAMNDGNEVASPIAEYVKAQGLDVALDGSLPDAPRVLAPRIADQASAKMYAAMPDCAEKQYMRMSLAARTWLELGGERSSLPVVDGYNDREMSARYQIWLDNGSEAGLEKIGEASKTPSIDELEGREKDPARLQALERANKAFVDFLMSENEWRQTNAFRLR